MLVPLEGYWQKLKSFWCRNSFYILLGRRKNLVPEPWMPVSLDHVAAVLPCKGGMNFVASARDEGQRRLLKIQ